MTHKSFAYAHKTNKKTSELLKLRGLTSHFLLLPNLLPQLLLQRLRQRRDNREQITDHAVACLLEDGRIGILVDGDDQLGISHADQVLDRARDAAGDVQIRRDDFARLPDLMGVGDVAAVHCRAGCADCAAEHLWPVRR